MSKPWSYTTLSYPPIESFPRTFPQPLSPPCCDSCAVLPGPPTVPTLFAASGLVHFSLHPLHHLRPHQVPVPIPHPQRHPTQKRPIPTRRRCPLPSCRNHRRVHFLWRYLVALGCGPSRRGCRGTAIDPPADFFLRPRRHREHLSTCS